MSTTIITRKKSKPVMVTPEKRPSYEKKVHQNKNNCNTEPGINTIIEEQEDCSSATTFASSQST